MNGVVSIQIEWVYTPENYFQSPLSIPIDGGRIEIVKGTVRAKIDPKAINVDQSIAEQLDDKVENLFHDEQLKSHKPYELGMPFKVVIRDDGSRTVSPT